jgi:putative ABC transport system substrate-binding protein
MNYARKVLIAGTVFLFLLTGIVSAATPNVLFINWRGQTPCDAGLRDGLKDLGVAINIEDFNADQDKAKLEAFLSTIDEKKYAFIYTFGTTVSTKTAAKVKNTPILFGIVTNPVKSGLVQSWDKSGNNVTGVSHAIPIADQVEFILGLGQFEKIGMVFNPKEKNSQIANEELSKQLSAKGVSYASYPVESEGDIKAVVEKASADKLGMMYLPSDSFINSQAEKIIPELSKHGIPTYGALEKQVKSGAMIGIVSSYYTVGKELSLKAAEVLKGKKPSDIPSNILPLESQTILVNAKTVETVKADIPYQILSTAKVVE